MVNEKQTPIDEFDKPWGDPNDRQPEGGGDKASWQDGLGLESEDLRSAPTQQAKVLFKPVGNVIVGTPEQVEDAKQITEASFPGRKVEFQPATDPATHQIGEIAMITVDDDNAPNGDERKAGL